MITLIWLVVLATSIWVLIDAKSIGVKKGQIKGVADMSPMGWFFLVLFLWIIGFPFYLAKREEYKRLNNMTHPAQDVDEHGALANKLICPACKSEVDADAAFCDQCGSALRKNENYTSIIDRSIGARTLSKNEIGIAITSIVIVIALLVMMHVNSTSDSNSEIKGATLCGGDQECSDTVSRLWAAIMSNNIQNIGYFADKLVPICIKKEVVRDDRTCTIAFTWAELAKLVKIAGDIDSENPLSVASIGPDIDSYNKLVKVSGPMPEAEDAKQGLCTKLNQEPLTNTSLIAMANLCESLPGE